MMAWAVPRLGELATIVIVVVLCACRGDQTADSTVVGDSAGVQIVESVEYLPIVRGEQGECRTWVLTRDSKKAARFGWTRASVA